jgi:hypothetical protein
MSGGARRWSGCALTLMMGLATLHTTARSQVVANTGALQGMVRAQTSMAPLPYAVVSVPSLSVERFTGASGVFLLPNLPVGTHDVTVRRLGFVAQQHRVTIAAGITTMLDVQLLQIPVRLATMRVRPVERCVAPGLPDATREPEVAQLVSLLRENAERYRLLVSQYPFVYAQRRAFGTIGVQEVFIDRVDSLLVQSRTRGRYAPGAVVSRVDAAIVREYSMALPTVLDLTDPAFHAVHCFQYGGASVHGVETWWRMDVRAADSLRTPDVHGVFYVDSASSQLRRMQVELSRPDRLPSSLRSIRAVQAATRFLEIAPGLSIIDGVCAVNWLSTSRKPTDRQPVELQQVTGYLFLTPPPDMAARVDRPPVPWVPKGRLPRATLTCDDLP